MAEGALIQQRKGLGHRQIGTMTGLGHQRRLECIQQVATGRQIIRQRHQGVGTAGVDNDRCLRVAAIL